MISDDHKLALRLIQIRREETLFKQKSLTDESFEQHWIREAKKLIENHRRFWENRAVDNYIRKKTLKHQ